MVIFRENINIESLPYTILMKCGECSLSERFSMETKKAREENRIVSALTAVTLIKEHRYPDAKIFAESFAQIKDVPADDLNKEVGWYFVGGGDKCANDQEITKKMLTVANILANDPESINDTQADECTRILTELLNAISTKTL